MYNGIEDIGKYKSRFRQTKKWTTFRDFMILKHKRCQLCGSTYKGKRTYMFNVHHLDDSVENYEKLDDDDDFRLLCQPCHFLVEKIIKWMETDMSKIPPKSRYRWYSLFNSIGLLKYYERDNISVKLKKGENICKRPLEN